MWNSIKNKIESFLDVDSIFVRGLIYFFAIFVFLLGLFVGFSFPTLLLWFIWNNVVVSLFALPALTFMQSFWFVILLVFFAGFFKRN
jgi:hypothetical protein